MLNKRRPSNIAKILFFCLFSILLLFLGFFMNFWQVADQQWFDNHQRDMENHILGRMVKSRQDGIFSAGGLTGIGSLDTTSINFETDRPFSSNYTAYLNGQQFLSYVTYNSQIGGQGMFFSILDKFITLQPVKKVSLFHAFTSLFSAITLTVIILWFYLEFGLTVSLFVLISAVFSQWLVVFGRNLWWSMWSFYLPVALIMHYLKFNRSQMNISYTMFGVIVFITVFIKCLFTGYEYITSTLVMMIVPFVYYGILNRLNIRKFLSGLFIAVFSSCLAILLSFVILCFQVASVTGNLKDGVNHIVYSFEKRTYANPHNFPPVLTPSLESNTTQVIITYLNGTFIDANKYLPFSIPFISRYLLKVHYSKLILLFLIMSGLLYFLRNRVYNENEKRKHLALIFATWFSILAPLSWFIVFKAHSYIHTHMNFIVWQMPFVFFGFAVCGLVGKILLSNFIHLTKMKI